MTGIGSPTVGNLRTVKLRFLSHARESFDGNNPTHLHMKVLSDQGGKQATELGIAYVRNGK